jgi:putative exporter of polyketide antibiotics
MNSRRRVNSTVVPLLISQMTRLLSLLIVLLIALMVSGQERQRTEEKKGEVDFIPATARGCQRNTINIANLEALLQTTKENVFVIAHLGTGETNPRLNRRRLNDVKTEFGLGNSP